MTQVPLVARIERRLFRAGQHLGAPWEVVTAIPVVKYTGGSPPPSPVRICSLPIPGCKKGQLLQCRYQIRVTNDVGRDNPIHPHPQYLVEFSWACFLATSSTGTAGYPMERVGGENIDETRHHLTQSGGADIHVPLDGDYWFAVMAYTGTDGNVEPGDFLTINPWGHASVVRW